MAKQKDLKDFFVLECNMDDPFVSFYWCKSKKKFRNIDYVTLDNLFSTEEQAKEVYNTLNRKIKEDTIIKPFEYPESLLLSTQKGLFDE